MRFFGKHLATATSFGLVLLFSACDAQLSQFDKVDVDVGAPKQSDVEAVGPMPTVAEPNAGVEPAPPSPPLPGPESPAPEAPAPSVTQDPPSPVTPDPSLPTSPTDPVTPSSSPQPDPAVPPSPPAPPTAPASPEPTPPASPTPPAPIATANAGSDQTIAVATTLTGLSSNATTWRWEKLSGPGAVSFAPVNAETTLFAGTDDGTYSLRFFAINADSVDAHDDVAITWDTHAPVIDALSTAIGTAAAPAPTVAANVTDISTYHCSWEQTAGPGTVTFGTPAATSTTVGADIDGQYTVKITCVDAIGLTSNRTMTYHRAAGTTFTAVPGPTIGTVALAMTFGDVTGFTSVKIYVADGATAPACGPQLTPVATVADLTQPYSSTYDTTHPGSIFSYSACLKDATDTYLQITASGVKAKPHVAFLTSDDSDGTFGSATDGLAAADLHCTNLAAAGDRSYVANETHWKAIISTSSFPSFSFAKTRIAIAGAIVRPDHESVGSASSVLAVGENLWDDHPALPISYDENGINRNSLYVWTGTTETGPSNESCGDWTQGMFTNGNVGSTDPARNWIDDLSPQDCGLTLPFYCISQY